jgi:hypothetical protein
MMRPEVDRGWIMIEKCKTVILIMLAVVLVAGPAMAQTYSGAGAYASGGSGVQVTGGGITVSPAGVKTFSLGSGYTYSITSVSSADAQQLQSQGVRVITAPAGKTIYVTSQAGQSLDIKAGDQGVVPNLLLFGPGGFAGTGILAVPGAGTGVFISPAGVSINAVPGAGTSVQVGGGAGAGGVSINAGPGIAPTQMYSFTGSAGDTYLITQQTGGTVDRVLVVFQ